MNILIYYREEKDRKFYASGMRANKETPMERQPIFSCLIIENDNKLSREARVDCHRIERKPFSAGSSEFYF